MRVLLTGAAGFIGSSVAEALLLRGDDVLGVDNFNTFYDPALKEQNVREVAEAARTPGAGRFTLHRLDLVTEPERWAQLFAEQRPDVVCHLAAWAGVRPSIQKPLLYQQVNVEGTLRLLEQAKTHGIKPFVFASSSSVYGAREQVPFHEDDRVDDPISPYAATKKAGELLGYTYAHLHGLSFKALRFFTVYGPRQRPEMAIHLFAQKILSGQPLVLFGQGTSRDYTYIDDCVQGVLGAIDVATKNEPSYRIYNLGGSETTTLLELVRHLESALGKKAILEHAPDQPGDVPRTYADITRAQTELGYNPQTPVSVGIPRFAAWLRRRLLELP